MFNIGTQELLLILLLALIVVGPQKLPELARSIGKGMREFRKMQDEVKDMVKVDLNPDPPTVHQPGVSGPKKARQPRTPRPNRTDAVAEGASEGPTRTVPGEAAGAPHDPAALDDSAWPDASPPEGQDGPGPGAAADAG